MSNNQNWKENAEWRFRPAKNGNRGFSWRKSDFRRKGNNGAGVEGTTPVACPLSLQTGWVSKRQMNTAGLHATTTALP